MTRLVLFELFVTNLILFERKLKKEKENLGGGGERGGRTGVCVCVCVGGGGVAIYIDKLLKVSALMWSGKLRCIDTSVVYLLSSSVQPPPPPPVLRHTESHSH